MGQLVKAVKANPE